jgi:hypothetical protein
MNLLFTEAFFTTHAKNSADNCSQRVFFNYEPSMVVSHLELLENWLITPTANSYKPLL